METVNINNFAKDGQLAWPMDKRPPTASDEVGQISQQGDQLKEGAQFIKIFLFYLRHRLMRCAIYAPLLCVSQE